jgi:DNA-binding NarL/FixJ family response regulator
MQQAKVDFVLLDMMIEDGFDGLDTYEIIREHWPDVVTLIASGYSESDRVKQAIELGAAGFMRKPYSKRDLATAVRSALDLAKKGKQLPEIGFPSDSPHNMNG